MLQCKYAIIRQTRKRTSREVYIDRPRSQKTRLVVSSRDVRRERHDDRVRGRGRLCTMSLIAPISGGRSMTVIVDVGNQADLEAKRISFTETNELGAMSSESQPVVT